MLFLFHFTAIYWNKPIVSCRPREGRRQFSPGYGYVSSGIWKGNKKCFADSTLSVSSKRKRYIGLRQTRWQKDRQTDQHADHRLADRQTSRQERKHTNRLTEKAGSLIDWLTNKMVESPHCFGGGNREGVGGGVWTPSSDLWVPYYVSGITILATTGLRIITLLVDLFTV